MYQVTAREIDDCIPKQANAIFITPNVSFAADFKKGVLGGVATWSEGWMVENDETNEGDDPVERLGGQSWNEYNSYWLDGLNKARAAIAKATGEQA
jgi:hypothetical protein